MNPSGYGPGRGSQQGYEAPACVQNAMMTKDKKPFTYTPGGIDLSQIKSERMAKRLARNAQAEGATGSSQQNRPTQQQSPPGCSAAAMGAAAMGMPFQVLPPPPSPVAAAGKNSNGGPAPPPPPPPSSNNNSNYTQNTLAPPNKTGVAPGSPNAARKSPAPIQRFEPPPLGFRPEIKIPPNPMAALRKVPPPVEKNTFWKDEYCKDRSKSPLGDCVDNSSSNNNNSGSTNQNNGNNIGESERNYNDTRNNNNANDNEDGYKKSMPNSQPVENTNNASSNAQQYSPQQQRPLQYPLPPISPPTQSSTPTPPPPQAQSPRSDLVSARQTDSPRSETATPPQQHQQLRSTESPFRLAQQQRPAQATSPLAQQPSPSSSPAPAPQQQRPTPAASPLAQQPQQRPAQATSPLAQQPSASTSPAPVQQQLQRPAQAASPLAQQQQLRPAQATSPLVQQPSASSSPAPAAEPSNATGNQVPWRTQRSQPTTQQQQQQQPTQSAATSTLQQQQQTTQPIYNNVQQQQMPQANYQASKPTNVGSLYIAPLNPPVEPQAQNIVRQQMMQQQQQPRDSPMRQMMQPSRDSPMRQMTPQFQQQTRPTPGSWMRSQAAPKEQPEWVHSGDNDGNVIPSSLQRMKSPPPPSQQMQQPQAPAQAPSQSYYQMQQPTMPASYGNGYAPNMNGQNFGATMHAAPAGLRLQINTSLASQNNNASAAPRERIIPIQLEQTPTYTPSPPMFNNYGSNNAGTQQYQQQQQQQQQMQQRIMSPTQQLNAPRIIQQQQQQQQQQAQSQMGAKTRIIPIALDGGEQQGSRGPISQTPIVLQNDPRSPPVQSKSFRILQKITDTDDGSETDAQQASSKSEKLIIDLDATPQLQRPQFARQMSAQQARNSPTIEQMRRMQLSQDQSAWNQGGPVNKFMPPQSPAYNNNMHHYVPASEQQVTEPKIYTGAAIPSRSFKILQAMTTPENAGPGQSDL